MLLLLGLLDTTSSHRDTLSSPRVTNLGRDKALDLVDLAKGTAAQLLDLLKHGPIALHGLGMVARATASRGVGVGLLTNVVARLLSTC